MSAFPVSSAGIAITARGTTHTAIPIPNGATSVSWSAIGTRDANPFFAPFPIGTCGITEYDASGVNIGSIDFLASSGHSSLPSYQGTRSLLPGTAYFYATAVNSGTGNPVPSDLDVTISFNCSPGISNSQPCCPPDPSILTAVQQMYQLLMSVYLGLPHQLNSYAAGATHAGLSGNGTITLAASVLGIRVNITTDPSTIGVDLGSPDFLFDRGFIVPVVNAAPIRGESRLVYNPQMFLLPALTEQVGYSLHPGVVISITELLRGP